MVVDAELDGDAEARLELTEGFADDDEARDVRLGVEIGGHAEELSDVVQAPRDEPALADEGIDDGVVNVGRKEGIELGPKSGTTQRELVSQSGPVHIKAIVGLMPSELVYVGTYVTWVVVPDLDILITVGVITDEFEPDVIVLLEGVAATEALEKELPGVEGAQR
ncbi:hypothetical protein HFD88_007393 [Aspergillus terreus]|nr:hypothetical protein HFD88_007393 [Aspergillus terreus]